MNGMDFLTRNGMLGAVGVALLLLAVPVGAQSPDGNGSSEGGSATGPKVVYVDERLAPVTPADARASQRVREAASRAGGRRVVISIAERQLWVLDGRDTVMSAPVGVGKATLLQYQGRQWDFSTPVGIHRVQAKVRNPVWIPPDWHYIELARDSSFGLKFLRRGDSVAVGGGSSLIVRGDSIWLRWADGGLELLPPEEEIILDRVLFVPPLGTRNRRIVGELGAYKLDLGDGYMLHGTPREETVGEAATHGCLRLLDHDIRYLYETIPRGTRVYIY